MIDLIAVIQQERVLRGVIGLMCNKFVKAVVITLINITIIVFISSYY